MKTYVETAPGSDIVECATNTYDRRPRADVELLGYPIEDYATVTARRAARHAAIETKRAKDRAEAIARDGRIGALHGIVMYLTNPDHDWVWSKNRDIVDREYAVAVGCTIVEGIPPWPVPCNKPPAASPASAPEPETPLTPHQLAMIENVKWRCAIIASPEAQARPAATRRMLEAWSPKSKTVEAARRFLAGLPSESTPLAVLAAPVHPATLAGGLDRAELRFRRRVEIYAAALSRKLNDPRAPRNPAGKSELRNIRTCLENAEASGFALSSLMKASGLDPRKYMEN